MFRLQQLADDVMLVHLRFPAGIRVKFKAGQHLNLILDNGERRDFSMANPPRESDGAQLHIRHVPGGAFTSYVFEKLKRGDRLKLEVPFGDFTLRESDKPILFVAGSTGFAPIKSIIEDMFIKNIRRDDDAVLGRAAASRASIPTCRTNGRRRTRSSNMCRCISDAPEPGIRHNLVHKAVLEDHPSLAGFQAYVCGVPVMTQAAQREFLAAGLAGRRVFRRCLRDPRRGRFGRALTRL